MGEFLGLFAVGLSIAIFIVIILTIIFYLNFRRNPQRLNGKEKQLRKSVKKTKYLNHVISVATIELKYLLFGSKAQYRYTVYTPSGGTVKCKELFNKESEALEAAHRCIDERLNKKPEKVIKKDLAGVT